MAPTPIRKQSDLSSFFTNRSRTPPAALVEEEPAPAALPLPLPVARDIATAGVQEAMNDELIATATGLNDTVVVTLSYQEVFDRFESFLARSKELTYREVRQLMLLHGYVRILLKEPHTGRIEASLAVARVFHDHLLGETLARRIRALFLYFRVYDGLPVEARGGKRNGRSLLDQEDQFNACRSWLLNQPVGTATFVAF